MQKFPLSLLLILLTVVSLSSCSVFIDVTLIREKAPELFKKENGLTKHEGDSLAARGIVAYGQTRQQVIKAWGRPERQSGCSINKEPRRLKQMVYPDRFAYVYLLGSRVCAIDPLDKYKILKNDPEE